MFFPTCLFFSNFDQTPYLLLPPSMIKHPTSSSLYDPPILPLPPSMITPSYLFLIL